MNFAKPVASLATSSSPLRPVQAHHNRWPVSYRSVGAVVVTGDVITILACGIAAGLVYNFGVLGETDDLPQYIGSAAVVAAFYVTVMKGYGFYDPIELLSLRTQWSSVTSVWLGVFLFLAGAVFALKIGDHFSRGTTLSFLAAGLVLLLAERLFYRSLLSRGLTNQKFNGRTAVLITDQEPSAVSELMPALIKHGFQLDNQFLLPKTYGLKKEYDRAFSDILSYLRGSDIEEVIVSADFNRWDDLKNLLAQLRVLPLPVNFIPAGNASEVLRRPSRIIGSELCIEVQREPLDAIERGSKRIIDILASLSGLIVLLPILALTAVMIKLDSSGPIFFRQKRCGFNGKQFYIFKFRTMTVLEDGAQIQQATRSDNRVTRLGKWLRRSSIDELPQLLNVLSGSMSLVGPRPHALAHDNHFLKIVSNYAYRHHMKPGLTGWAQVNGHRGATPTVEQIRDRVECDLWYIDNWSLRLDFLIMFRTIFEIMRGHNAY
jgi:Undecaprenyl-phosphate glucose phosphotransferase